MTHAYRPTTGNTAAIDRFNPNGPKGYAPVYNDGTHGPAYATRDEAEKDYARKANPDTTHTAIQVDDSGAIALDNHELSRLVGHINDNAATFTVTDLGMLSEGRPTKYAWFRVEGMGSDYTLGIDPLNNQEWNMRQLAAGRTWDDSGVFTS